MDGVPAVGETLTATPAPSSATVNYQWQKSDAENGVFEDIDDAVNKIYIISDADKNSWIRVKVTATGRYTGTKTSEAVGPISILVSTSEGLTEAIETAEENDTILISGTLGSEENYTNYEIKTDGLSIQGLTDCKIYGTFVVNADDVTVTGLEIQNKGNKVGEASVERGAIYLYADSGTITNNIIRNGLGDVKGYSNGIQVMRKSKTINEDTSCYVITGNHLIEHKQFDDDWSSAGIIVSENLSTGAVTEDGKKVPYYSILVDDYKIATENTFTGNAIDYVHQNWENYASEGTTVYALVSSSEKFARQLDKLREDATILLAAGTYAENVVVDKKGITLQAVADVNPEMTGTVTVNANNVIIDGLGFVVLSEDNDAGDSIVLGGNVEKATVKNCKFDAQNRFMTEPHVRAVQIGKSGKPCKDITIENCTFKDGYYVTIQGRVNGLTVENSSIENCKSGINLQAGEKLIVENTDISVVVQGEPNDTYCVRFASETSDSGNGMSITGGTFAVDKDGLKTTEGTYHSAIVVREGATGELVVTGVNINGEVVNLSVTQLDAAHNYWGHESGPYHPDTNRNGLGNSVSDNVLFFPWYEDEEMGTGSSVEGVVNTTTMINYPSIKLAIAGAKSKDTILVSAGTYTGDLTVNVENLALKATDGVGVTTIKGNITISGDNVTIEGFTIDGEVEGPSVAIINDIFDKNNFAQESIILELEDGTAKIVPPAEVSIINTTRNRAYETIQIAVNVAEQGDIIELAEGTYKESILIDKSNVTLQSKDGADQTTIDGDGAENTVKITADGVTLDGFTITGAHYQYAGAIFLDSVEACTIKNNLVTGNYRAGIFMRQADNNTIENNTIRENTIGIHMVHGDYATSTSCNYNTIEGNTIENNAAYGISLSSSYSQANAATGNTIKNNIIKNNNKDAPSYNKQDKGITITGVWVSNTIEDNTISGHNYNGISSDNSAQNNVIKNNSIDNNGKAYSGTGVENGAGIYFASASEAESDASRASFGNIIEANTITNNWNGIDLRGLTGKDTVVMYDNTIRGNTISSNTVNGIYLYDGVSNNTIEENMIVNNATHASREGYGVHATQRTEGNAATHNWWGSANGPGQDGANGVSDNVTYDPWYTDEEMTTLSNAEEGTDNVDMFNINSEALGKEASMDEEKIEELDITPIDTAIEAAKVAKEGITVSEDGTDVPAGTYWVTQEDMDALDAAIAEAEAAKESAETQQDVAEAVEALEAAVSTFNDAKQEAIDEEEIGASEEGEEPVQGEELADDEESVEDEEAVEGEEQEE